MSKERKICEYCGDDFTHNGQLRAHVGSLRCRYLQAQRRQQGRAKLSINCRPRLDRLNIPYAVDIGNYHLGSKGTRGIVTHAVYVAPRIAAIWHNARPLSRVASDASILANLGAADLGSD